MPTKKTHFTITEAAKKLGVSRAALHDAISNKRLKAKWGETVQTIRQKTLLISAEDLKAYSRRAKSRKPKA